MLVYSGHGSNLCTRGAMSTRHQVKTAPAVAAGHGIMDALPQLLSATFGDPWEVADVASYKG